MKPLILLLFSLLLGILPTLAQEDAARLRGKITDENGQPLPGVAIFLKAARQGTATDADGLFSLALPLSAISGGDTLKISYLGYTSEEYPLTDQRYFEISLAPDIARLMEVEIVSTGYQQLPRERSTGSFAQLDEALINRSVSPDVLSRLEDVTSGLIFNRAGARSDAISIRGRSTLFANASPLIVVDNFPYEGAIENINPNDVESITVLKDAAAASIWGARAGNGVIVITTKKGAYGEGPRLSFNANTTLGEQPDPFYRPQMPVADFIATERRLFEEGFYNASETFPDRRALTPLVELLIDHREGRISEEALSARIGAMQQQDIRRDYERYLYRPMLNQQYAASLRGGGKQHRYYLSGGYDHNLENLEGNNFRRFTLNMRHDWSLLADKLQLSGELAYARSGQERNGLDPQGLRLSAFNSLPLYVGLANASGNPLAVPQDYRMGFVENAIENGLLDWQYRPLEERALIDRSSQLTDYRLNGGLRYEILPSLSAELRYQYWHSLGSNRNHYGEESYYARNLINQYTQLNPDGSLVRAIPLGGILDRQQQASYSHNGRLQLNWARSWDRHELNAIGGYEVREQVNAAESYRYYGYDDRLAISAPVDYKTLFALYHYPARRATIPFTDSQSELTDRFISYYANASYSYDRRYTLTLSARKDQSNLFGVRANQRGVPLWSSGLGWTLSEEAFYRWDALPYLKLRATYGYNGNIDKSVTAYTTARMMGSSFNTGLLYATITNPPNPELGWERVEVKNFGLDFESRAGRLRGSFEYFTKKGLDLIAFAPLPPSSGQREYKGNTAATAGHGLDVTLSSLNLDGAFSWRTDLLYSLARSRVTSYKGEVSANYIVEYGDMGTASGQSIVEGGPLYGLYSYAWAGLNPDTGNPQGYLEGEVSEDYAGILNTAERDDLVFHGPARPTSFGALRNTFTFKGFSLSANISYRLGYYFRRESIVYGQMKGLGGHGDYVYRWQQPGDEAYTQVPSIPETGNMYRDRFYTYSEALVERGDHIRLQDVNLGYTFERERMPGLPFARLELFAYARNLGILWKATQAVPDPDYRSMNALSSYALGLRADF